MPPINYRSNISISHDTASSSSIDTKWKEVVDIKISDNGWKYE